MEIQSADQASKIIKKAFFDLNIQTVYYKTHFNPHGNHVRLRNPNSGTVYHIKFQREPFMTFGYIFRQHQGKIGETIDEDAIKDLKDTDVLLFCYPDKIYEITVNEFRDQALSRPNDRDHGKITLSVPITSLKRFL